MNMMIMTKGINEYDYTKMSGVERAVPCHIVYHVTSGVVNGRVCHFTTVIALFLTTLAPI